MKDATSNAGCYYYYNPIDEDTTNRPVRYYILLVRVTFDLCDHCIVSKFQLFLSIIFTQIQISKDVEIWNIVLSNIFCRK